MSTLPNKNLIVPFAKQAGLTSFASMSAVKKALSTKKVGHTGTLDLFADGLLVLLTGKLTRLADIISAEKKAYEAWMEFGIETDTLDPEGETIAEAPLPSYKNLTEVIPSFLDKSLQRPPEFSAIKINGKRASDRIRNGEKIEIAEREIEIYKLNLKKIITESGLEFTESDFLNINADTKIKYAHISIECSKGTYIRSLVRDIAKKAHTCAYVSALRRTAVGSFKLEDAAGFSLLDDFSIKIHDINASEIKTFNAQKETNYKLKEILPSEIIEKALEFTPQTAENLKLSTIFLDEKYLKDFYNGKKIKETWFFDGDKFLKKSHENTSYDTQKICVFCNNLWSGIIRIDKDYFKYETVIQN
ncbi:MULTISPECIES: tRNA pseudouridine(55) synthase TruB [unclassified Treponema]|uniref:tRNA pseudouridine(55) synthase TruB n=1 Tax=unclassified Treponema TaxID=2638727 RepID=UPI0020A2829D|nr:MULTISPECIES: tRNA pseudouridine(55) synthase TruB [unclassified Treponema]UTC65927.1 tRNA pseudouridine(55) synthase TruB [Treponema sp. OMZ 789]UTC68655.1 tRNA pseudouridine(55) synthase TruB [Treponema sp. OMZ 790]UTC71385.1 tRNA pseudouridine(55) synthase TruB [Treponema sp. OMZ 791]